MILYISVAAITILLAAAKEYAAGKVSRQDAYGSRARYFGRACMAAIFVILTLVSAFRVNVGNDYATYVEFMHRLYTDKYIADAGVPTEWGFNLLARIVYALSGGENFLLVFAIYAAVTIAVFLYAMWEMSDDFALSFFMFMTLGMYLQSFSTVRYYLALSVALYSLKLVNEKRWISFILLVLIASAFHKSVLVIIPLYLMATYAWKKWQLAIVLAFFVSCLFLKDIYLDILIKLYPSYEGTAYLAGSEVSYINIIRCVLVLALAVYCYRGVPGEEDREGRMYFYLNLGALGLYIFCNFLPVVSRIGYYLTVSQLIFVPRLTGMLRAASQDSPSGKKITKQTLVYAAIVIVCILYFAIYLRRASSDGVLVLPYRTFFFHDMVDILSDVG